MKPSILTLTVAVIIRVVADVVFWRTRTLCQQVAATAATLVAAEGFERFGAVLVQVQSF